MSTVATIKTDIMQTLDRDDLSSNVAIWLAAAHRDVQRVMNYDCQKATFAVLSSSVTYEITAPTDIKEPRFLCRVGGTDLNAVLLPSAGVSLQSPFYERVSYEDILSYRASLYEDGREADSTTTRVYALENGIIHIVPKNDIITDHFVFGYYKMLPLPDDNASDWFTNNAQDVLTYKSLLMSLGFLDESDDRGTLWTKLLAQAESRLFGHLISIEYGGQNLVMRG